MTCIAGLVADGKVYIGGDSLGTRNGYLSVTLVDSKVFRVGSFLVGVCGDVRLIQLLRYKWTPPEQSEDVSVERYLVCDVADSIRACLKENAYASVESNVEKGGQFLLGYRGRLFEVDDNYEVAELRDGYNAIGSGDEVALGALHATAGLEPIRRIQMALEAATHHIESVGPPFIIETLG